MFYFFSCFTFFWKLFFPPAPSNSGKSRKKVGKRIKSNKDIMSSTYSLSHVWLQNNAMTTWWRPPAAKLWTSDIKVNNNLLSDHVVIEFNFLIGDIRRDAKEGCGSDFCWEFQPSILLKSFIFDDISADIVGRQHEWYRVVNKKVNIWHFLYQGDCLE